MYKIRKENQANTLIAKRKRMIEKEGKREKRRKKGKMEGRSEKKERKKEKGGKKWKK